MHNLKYICNFIDEKKHNYYNEGKMSSRLIPIWKTARVYIVLEERVKEMRVEKNYDFRKKLLTVHESNIRNEKMYTITDIKRINRKSLF